MRKATKETIKSFLRDCYFAVLGFIGTFLLSLSTSESLTSKVIHVGGDIYLQVGVVAGVVLAFVAKYIDKYIHKNDKIALNGITPIDLIKSVETE